MTNNNKFFSDQKANTEIKLKFYSQYIETYLIKVLMQFGVCFIGDLFCGQGRNGDKKGSPLLLLDVASKILNSSALKIKHSRARMLVLFNDEKEVCVNSLKNELIKRGSNKRIKINIRQQTFQEFMKDDILEKLKGSDIPKFIFLDPYNYSTIRIGELKELMSLPRTEVLLFCPTFHAYRFAGAEKPPQKLITFLEDFTQDGVKNYTDSYEFIESIHTKLKNELETDLVKPIPIDYGSTKHTLFYITRHLSGMMIMNNIFLKDSADGKCINVRGIKKLESTPSLFKKSEIETTDFRECLSSYQSELIELLKTKGKMTNTEIIRHAVVCGWLPKHAKEAIVRVKNNLEIEYLYEDKKIGCYVSETNWNKELCVIHHKML